MLKSNQLNSANILKRFYAIYKQTKSIINFNKIDNKSDLFCNKVMRYQTPRKMD